MSLNAYNDSDKRGRFKYLPLDAIRLDYQDSVNEYTRNEYIERMAYHERFPPVIVFFDGETYWLSDGFHRVAAARFLGRTMIEAEIFAGTYADLVENVARERREFIQAFREWSARE